MKPCVWRAKYWSFSVPTLQREAPSVLSLSQRWGMRSWRQTAAPASRILCLGCCLGTLSPWPVIMKLHHWSDDTLSCMSVCACACVCVCVRAHPHTPAYPLLSIPNASGKISNSIKWNWSDRRWQRCQNNKSVGLWRGSPLAPGGFLRNAESSGGDLAVFSLKLDCL